MKPESMPSLPLGVAPAAARPWRSGVRACLAALACNALLFVLAGPALAQGREAQTVVHLLDYIGVDYASAVEHGKVKSADEYREMREFAAQAAALIDALPSAADKAQLSAGAAALARQIEAKAEPGAVAAQATSLRALLIRVYDVSLAPKRAPDLARGATLYATQCAVCHGAQGWGNGPAGTGLEPPPSDFHDARRMASRSVYGLYNTITLGVDGTGMASYRRLSEDERWALAFYVAHFAADAATRERGAALWAAGTGRGDFADVTNVVALSANEVRQRFGTDGVAVQAYLRAHPEALATLKPAPIDVAVATLDRSLDAYRAGRRAQATQLAIEAYLEGFELAESSLHNVDAALMARIEREMMVYRGLLQAAARVEAVEKQAGETRALLVEARAKLDTRLSPAATFGAALVILLREGAEAILVVAAILAFLARAGRADLRRYVHAGWLAAFALGLVTWLVSSRVVAISGASREMTEGVTALLSAAMLLYVGYWLHSKAHSQAWQKYIGDKLTGALSAGAVWTLTLIAFLAVYREAFETVLFYQALSAQAGPGGRAALLAGLAAAAMLLVALGWAIVRASVKLPIGRFFSVSGVLLLILAVVFTGQGIAALQEAGRIGADAVGFVTLPLLGVYPTAQTLSAQVAVITISAFSLWWVAHAGKSTPDDNRER